MDRRPIYQVQASYDGEPVTVVGVFAPIADCDHPVEVPYLDKPHSSFEVGYQVQRWLAGLEVDAGWTFARLGQGVG